MEDPELPADQRRFRRFPVWIIEHVWTHRTMDIQQAVDPSDWPDVDSQPLSTEDSWRLRVASAQMFCIVRSRDVQHFERVIKYLDATFRLLPRLVAPIKHMKIMFGLKTLVVMWMLSQRRGTVETVLKIIQFFPNKLPQYQDQCNQHEMFLMRKNNLDFRVLAQALAMDEDKLQHYVKTQMQQTYGERYAQKVEDRLLHYLQELEAALPGDTFIDKILKKESPVTEEEKLLLDVITSDCTTIATTLRKLLHCDAASCRQAVPRASEPGATSESVVCISSSKSLFSSVEDKTPRESQPEVLRPGDVSAQEVSAGSPDVGRRLQSREEDEMETSLMETSLRTSLRASGAASPQFCSRHRRWVRSILQECPDECPEEPQASSPPLFHWSSCTPSSQDLTPSDLVPCPPDRQLTPPQSDSAPPQSDSAPPQSDSAPPQSDSAPPQASEQRNLEDERRLSPPVVSLMDVPSVRGSCLLLQPHQASPDPFISQLPASTPPAPASPRDCESASPTNPTNTPSRSQASPVSQEASAFPSCGTPRPQTSLRLSLKHRRALTASRRSQTQDGAEQLEQDPASHRPSSDLLVSSPSASQSSSRNPSSPRSTPQNSTDLLSVRSEVGGAHRPSSVLLVPSPSAHESSPSASQSEAVSSNPSSPRSTPQNHTDLLSVRSEVVLLQPYVSLTRLSAEACLRLTRSRWAESESHGDEEQASDSSFDLSFLYSSRSSSGDGDDSLDSDPDYRPPAERRRRLS